MKITVCIFSLLAFCFSNKVAASNISRNCTNASGTILIDGFSTIKIITGMYAQNGAKEIQSISFDQLNDVKMNVKESITINIDSGCSFNETTSVQKITISKINGEKMPNAYSKNVNPDGTLTDILLCSESKTWWPAPGACK